jgi:hypothetical protein
MRHTRAGNTLPVVEHVHKKQEKASTIKKHRTRVNRVIVQGAHNKQGTIQRRNGTITKIGKLIPYDLSQDKQLLEINKFAETKCGQQIRWYSLRHQQGATNTTLPDQQQETSGTTANNSKKHSKTPPPQALSFKGAVPEVGAVIGSRHWHQEQVESKDPSFSRKTSLTSWRSGDHPRDIAPIIQNLEDMT